MWNYCLPDDLAGPGWPYIVQDDLPRGSKQQGLPWEYSIFYVPTWPSSQKEWVYSEVRILDAPFQYPPSPPVHRIWHQLWPALCKWVRRCSSRQRRRPARTPTWLLFYYPRALPPRTGINWIGWFICREGMTSLWLACPERKCRGVGFHFERASENGSATLFFYCCYARSVFTFAIRVNVWACTQGYAHMHSRTFM